MSYDGINLTPCEAGFVHWCVERNVAPAAMISLAKEAALVEEDLEALPAKLAAIRINPKIKRMFTAPVAKAPSAAPAPFTPPRANLPDPMAPTGPVNPASGYSVAPVNRPRTLPRARRAPPAAATTAPAATATSTPPPAGGPPTGPINAAAGTPGGAPTPSPSMWSRGWNYLDKGLQAGVGSFLGDQMTGEQGNPVGMGVGALAYPLLKSRRLTQMAGNGLAGRALNTAQRTAEGGVIGASADEGFSRYYGVDSDAGFMPGLVGGAYRGARGRTPGRFARAAAPFAGTVGAGAAAGTIELENLGNNVAKSYLNNAGAATMQHEAGVTPEQARQITEHYTKQLPRFSFKDAYRNYMGQPTPSTSPGGVLPTAGAAERQAPALGPGGAAGFLNEYGVPLEQAQSAITGALTSSGANPGAVEQIKPLVGAGVQFQQGDYLGAAKTWWESLPMDRKIALGLGLAGMASPLLFDNPMAEGLGMAAGLGGLGYGMGLIPHYSQWGNMAKDYMPGSTPEAPPPSTTPTPPVSAAPPAAPLPTVPPSTGAPANPNAYVDLFKNITGFGPSAPAS